MGLDGRLGAFGAGADGGGGLDDRAFTWSIRFLYCVTQPLHLLENLSNKFNHEWLSIVRSRTFSCDSTFCTDKRYSSAIILHDCVDDPLREA